LNQAYLELLQITQSTLTQARAVAQALHQLNHEAATRLHQKLCDLILLVEQAHEQAFRRVVQNESLPAQAKVLSLVEPHTQIIRRGKPTPKDTEFGHKVNYAEVEGGLVSDWQLIAEGNPPDDQLLPAILHQHVRRFGHAPEVLAGDSGLFSPANEQLARQLGVKHIALRQPGAKTAQRRAYEKQPWFKHAQRFRNGVEGRISVVRRTVQLARCPSHGLAGFERWIGWGLLVANLVILARHRIKRRRRPKPA
jgi:IS5 family transposase